MTGHIVGSYRLERPIGRGGAGEVWLATHVQLGHAVAIKRLREGAPRDLAERFRREARTAATLASEHVVRIVDAGDDAGTPFFVMEYLDGSDLKTILSQRGVLRPAEAIHLVLQACEGLGYAHARGVVHRDVKPANLFLARRSNDAPILKILDFGISKIEDPFGGGMTTANTILGSPKYMSPEQVRSSRDVDPRTDIWALGVVLYELATGRLPFTGKTTTQIVASIVIDPPAPIEGAEAALRDVIFRCLEKDRDKRFASVSELSGALAAVRV